MNPLTSIELDSPPPSPILVINVLAAPAEPSSSPAERQNRKKRRTGSRKRKRLDPTSEHLVLENDASDWPETAHDTDSNTPDNIVTHTDEIISVDTGHSRDDADDIYSRFIDAVLADDAPFYQITREMYVVSGWNVQEECNYVRPSQFVIEALIDVNHSEYLVSSANHQDWSRSHRCLCLSSRDG